MGKASRDKGGRGEREFMAIIQPLVDKVCEETGNPKIVLRRNRDQRFAKKQYDVIGIPWIALEIKRQENPSGIGSWWKQTLQACGHRQYPVLAYRQNYQPWKIRMRVHVAAGGGWMWMTINITLEAFLEWFEQMLRQKLKE